jgi:nitroreductase/FMN reductase [NAD(P)H]
MNRDTSAISKALHERFGEDIAVPPELSGNAFAALATRGVTRRFNARPVEMDLVRALCALALSSPTKSDLQQRDIVVVRDRALRGRLCALMPGQDWLSDAPLLLVFCGNNRRQRLLHEMRGRPFVNDHLDAFFNAAVDAAIALSAFVAAAALCGLGTCPVSAIRNRAAEVSDLLQLPQHVFPVAGLAAGWPQRRPAISLRLPLSATVHENTFAEDGTAEAVARYDRRRAAAQPYAEQKFAAEYGVAEDYCWSEDKARQYSKPEREAFGAFVRAKGFRLD